jgi:hypothetical protein
MQHKTRPSSNDPLGRFEPGWSKVWLAVWLAALVVVAVIRKWWPELLSYAAGVRFALYWTLGFFSVGAVVIRIAAARRRQLARAERERLCIYCGYDLRASSGRCPECGAEQSPGGPSAA